MLAFVPVVEQKDVNYAWRNAPSRLETIQLMNQLTSNSSMTPDTSENASLVLDHAEGLKPGSAVSPFWTGSGGVLFAGDCMAILPMLRDASVDTIFADPRFNLGKLYGRNTDDGLKEEQYLAWCEKWLAECVRIVKPGGSVFLYNLPKWNIQLGAFLSQSPF